MPGKSHGHRSLAGYSPWDPEESDTTEYTHMRKCNIGIKFSTIRNKVQNRKRDIDVQNRLLDFVGEGEGGMFRENSIETSIVSRVKQITSPGWMHESSAWGWCIWIVVKDVKTLVVYDVE